jgi:hypothetical protein
MIGTKEVSEGQGGNVSGHKLSDAATSSDVTDNSEWSASFDNTEEIREPEKSAEIILSENLSSDDTYYGNSNSDMNEDDSHSYDMEKLIDTSSCSSHEKGRSDSDVYRLLWGERNGNTSSVTSVSDVHIIPPNPQSSCAIDNNISKSNNSRSSGHEDGKKSDTSDYKDDSQSLAPDGDEVETYDSDRVNLLLLLSTISVLHDNNPFNPYGTKTAAGIGAGSDSGENESSSEDGEDDEQENDQLSSSNFVLRLVLDVNNYV